MIHVTTHINGPATKQGILLNENLLLSPQECGLLCVGYVKHWFDIINRSKTYALDISSLINQMIALNCININFKSPFARFRDYKYSLGLRLDADKTMALFTPSINEIICNLSPEKPIFNLNIKMMQHDCNII